MNIHPADTKLYQGAHGYEWAFDSGRESTTITIHFIDEGVDTGPVIAQRTVDEMRAAIEESASALGQVADSCRDADDGAAKASTEAMAAMTSST